MKPNHVKFSYRKPQPLYGWGCRFDSLTELRFAISVMEDHAVMRSPVSMYFHPATGQLAHFPKGAYLRYTPDFLIRNYETRKATLVEIKPRAFENEASLSMHHLVANNYIRSLKLDWQYQVIFDDQIVLTEEQLSQYTDCLALAVKDRFKWYEEYYKRITGKLQLTAFKSNAEIEFLMRGWLPEK
jgi:hypothetical protein